MLANTTNQRKSTVNLATCALGDSPVHYQWYQDTFSILHSNFVIKNM